MGQPPQTKGVAPSDSNSRGARDASAQREGVLQQARGERRADPFARTDPQVEEGLETELAQHEGVGLLT